MQVLGPECVSLYNLTCSGQHQAAAELQKRLIAPNQAVTRQYGVPGLKDCFNTLPGSYFGVQFWVRVEFSLWLNKPNFHPNPEPKKCFTLKSSSRGD